MTGSLIGSGTLTTWIGLLVAALGALVTVLAGVGVLRLPDSFARLHAATKAGTLGAALMLLGAALVLGVGWLTAGLTILVLLVTLPVSAQMLARAAYLSGTEMAPLSRPDPLADIVRRGSPPSAVAGEEPAAPPGRR
jgi:multicomponent Na+:H+ antiporter subunit G